MDLLYIETGIEKTYKHVELIDRDEDLDLVFSEQLPDELLSKI